MHSTARPFVYSVLRRLSNYNTNEYNGYNL